MGELDKILENICDRINTVTITDPINKDYLIEVLTPYSEYILNNQVIHRNRELRYHSAKGENYVKVPKLKNHEIINSMETKDGFIVIFRDTVNHSSFSIELYWENKK